MNQSEPLHKRIEAHDASDDAGSKALLRELWAMAHDGQKPKAKRGGPTAEQRYCAFLTHRAFLSAVQQLEGPETLVAANTPNAGGDALAHALCCIPKRGAVFDGAAATEWQARASALARCLEMPVLSSISVEDL